MYLRHYSIGDEDTEPDHYKQCVVCRERNAFPGKVCQYCFDREMEFEADSLIEDLCEPRALDEPEYKPIEKERSMPTADLFRAAVAEATVAMYKSDYTEHVENLLKIGVVIRDRIERYRQESGGEKVGESGYSRAPYAGPSLIDLAMVNCRIESYMFMNKQGRSI